MLSIAFATLRLRWPSFLGTFVALALGSGLIAAMGQVLVTTVGGPDRAPQRYAAAPVVVAPNDHLTVPTSRGSDTAPLAEPGGLPADLVARLAGAVVDRTFDAQLGSGLSGGVGRPWSASRLAPQILLRGRPPASGDEIAVSGDASLGDRVAVLTAAGVGEYTVVGITTTGPQPTVFFTDARAAVLSPRVDALAMWQPEATVRAVVGEQARVLTGSDRAQLDPTRQADAEARNSANVIVGISLGFAAFVAILVVASTFAFAVSQRRREFALLRAIGATPSQLRRMVLAEAALVAVIAGTVGSVFGPRGAPTVLRWLAARAVAPDWLQTASPSVVPSFIAFATAVAVALLGVVAAVWRAGGVSPAEAVRETSVQAARMPLGRWVLGGAAMLGAFIATAVAVVGDPASAGNRRTYMPVVMLLVAAAALLAPAVVRPVARLLTAPLSRLRGAGGVMVSTSVAASTRRTAAIAVPVLLTVGLATSLLTASALTDSAANAVQSRPVLADFVVVPAGAPGLDRELVDRLRAIPGVDVSATTPTSVYTLEGDTTLVRRPAEAIDPGTIGPVLRTPVVDGAIADLHDDTIIVKEDWGLLVGDTAQIWLADGSKASLTVVALLPSGGPTDSYVTAAHAFAALPSAAYVKLRPGTSPAAAADALHQATAGHRARATTTADWAAANDSRRGTASRLGLLVVLGIVFAFTAVALVNTQLMAAPDRAAERRTLSLLGATRAQGLRYVAAEAVVTVCVGVVLAGTVAFLVLAGMWLALARVAGPIAITIPWPDLAAVTAGCAVFAVASSVLPAWFAHSSPPAQTVLG